MDVGARKVSAHVLCRYIALVTNLLSCDPHCGLLCGDACLGQPNAGAHLRPEAGAAGPGRWRPWGGARGSVRLPEVLPSGRQSLRRDTVLALIVQHQ